MSSPSRPAVAGLFRRISAIASQVCGTGKRVTIRVHCGIVVAGGRGVRFGEKKQYKPLAGKPMWWRSTTAMLKGGFERIWLVVPAEDVAMVAEAIDLEGMAPLLTVTAGGTTRFESVRRGLEALLAVSDVQLGCIGVHDAARPFVLPADVRAVLERAQDVGGAILALPCPDTVKRAEGDAVGETVARDGLWLAQTPQVFRANWMRTAYFANVDFRDVTDDASVMELSGFPVALVPVTGENRKITSPADWEYADCLAQLRWGGEAT